MTKPLRLGIGIVSTGSWVDKFGLSLVNMVAAFQTHRVGNYTSQMLQVFHVRGSILPKQRLDVVKEAQAANMSHLLWIDTDHTFPRSLAHRLLQHGKEVVAINCVTKCLPAQPTARMRGATPGEWTPVYTDPTSHGLERVDRIGTGIMLMDMRVFNKLGPACFNMFYREDVKAYQGEDWSMGDRLEELGVPVYIDHDLSREVGHIGSFEFTHEYVGELQC